MGTEGLQGQQVVLVGGFDYSYPRETVLRDATELAGAEVHACRYGDDTMFPTAKKLLLLPYFYLLLSWRLWRLARTLDSIDVILVTKFNPLLLPLAALYARRYDAVLVYDLFVSLHRTADMRGYPWPVVTAMAQIERVMYRIPTHLLVGTDALANLYAGMYGLPRDRFVRIPPAADEDRFYPRDIEKRDVFTVLYWGNFLPHHGVDVILEAAAELRSHDDIEFVFLGAGPRQTAAQRQAEALELSNVAFEGFVPEEELHRWIGQAHVCLGVFSDDIRALASITNKVCESVASGKATITEDSPATREIFTPNENIYLVSPADPADLATAVLTLRDDPSLIETLEQGAYALHQDRFATEEIAQLLIRSFGERDELPTPG